MKSSLDYRIQPLAISTLSNGLLFSSKKQAQTENATFIHNLDKRVSEPIIHMLTDKEPEIRRNPIPTGAIYRSLIPTRVEPEAGSCQKPVRRVRSSRKGRFLSSASSQRSTVSSAFSIRTARQKITLLDLPVELIDDIFSNLDQPSLLELLQVSKQISSLCIRHLYFDPQFRSTYRFAQFVTTVSHNQELANYVKVLDLSAIPSQVREGTGEVLAGWRDWKLRAEPFYTVSGPSTSTVSQRTTSLIPPDLIATPQPRVATTPASMKTHPLKTRNFTDSYNNPKSENTKKQSKLRRYSKFTNHQAGPDPTPKRKQPFSLRSQKSTQQISTPVPVSTKLNTVVQKPASTHPTQSFRLKKFLHARDIPLGALLHIFKCCRNLHIIDLSRVTLANDYFITSRTKYPITSLSGHIFVSDVACLNTWLPQDVCPVHPTDLVEALCELRFLVTLNVKSATWLTTDLVRRFIDKAESVRFTGTLRVLDFTDSGLAKNLKWAVQGTPDKIKKALEDKEIAESRPISYRLRVQVE